MAVTLKLTKSISVGGQDVFELILSEPTLGMLDGVTLRITAEGELNIDLGAMRVLLARMANIPPSAASNMSIKDAISAKEVLSDFFDDFLGTGGTNLPN